MKNAHPDSYQDEENPLCWILSMAITQSEAAQKAFGF